MYTSVAEVLAAYNRGERVFENVAIDRADFAGCRLSGARFYRSSLRGADFESASLDTGGFPESDLSGANLTKADLWNARFALCSLTGAVLAGANAGAADFAAARLTDANMTDCSLPGSVFVRTDLSGATLDRVWFSGTTFADSDLAVLCDAAEVSHSGPSHVDFRSVLLSYRHPGLKRFLVDCGVPPLVAEYTIAAAEAEGDALGSLMRSTFISYGGPDEVFARRLYEELRAHGVTTFFFPESARLGRRIGDEVHSRIQEHDRVILVCSRASLNRPGVRNEIQETFDREARDGGATYLIPIMLDDYVLTGWNDPLAARVRDRVVGDFRGAMDDDRKFDAAMRRLLAELRKDPG